MPPRFVSTPTEPLFRLGRRQDPLAWVPWSHVGWGRFDHPLPSEKRYRVLYGGERRACFLETLARFRPSAINDEVEILTHDWIETRAVVRFSIQDDDRQGVWLDLRAAETLQFFHDRFKRLLARMRLSDFDLSMATSQNLVVTQEVGAWAFDEGCHGLVYASRFDHRLSCWAIFERPDSLPLTEVRVEAVAGDDSDLVYAIELFGLPRP
jgi:hypothetical protein